MGENKLKKGVEYTGTVTGYDFPNKGIVYIDPVYYRKTA